VGLPNVSFDPAVMMDAQNDLLHSPDPGWASTSSSMSSGGRHDEVRPLGFDASPR